MTTLPTLQDFQEARRYVSAHAKHTPLLTSRLLSERTGSTSASKPKCFSAPVHTKFAGRSTSSATSPKSSAKMA